MQKTHPYSNQEDMKTLQESKDSFSIKRVHTLYVLTAIALATVIGAGMWLGHSLKGQLVLVDMQLHDIQQNSFLNLGKGAPIQFVLTLPEGSTVETKSLKDYLQLNDVGQYPNYCHSGGYVVYNSARTALYAMEDSGELKQWKGGSGTQCILSETVGLYSTEGKSVASSFDLHNQPPIGNVSLENNVLLLTLTDTTSFAIVVTQPNGVQTSFVVYGHGKEALHSATKGVAPAKKGVAPAKKGVAPAKKQPTETECIGEDCATQISLPSGQCLNANAKMYWIDHDYRTLKRANLDGSDVEVLLEDNFQGRSIALDERNAKIYWTDRKNKAIWRVNLDGTYAEKVLTKADTFIKNPLDIIVDDIHGHIYWTDKSIRRANLDGSNVEVILAIENGGDYVKSINVDPLEQKLYWIGFDTAQKTNYLYRSNLDGTEREDIAEAGSGNQYDLHLDLDTGKVYWWHNQKYRSSSLRRANLDGSNMEIIREGTLAGMGRFTLDFVTGKMYITQTSAGNSIDRIQRSNFDGTETETLVDSGLRYPHAIVTASCKDPKIVQGCIGDACHASPAASGNTSTPSTPSTPTTTPSTCGVVEQQLCSQHNKQLDAYRILLTEQKRAVETLIQEREEKEESFKSVLKVMTESLEKRRKSDQETLNETFEMLEELLQEYECTDA